MTPPVGSSAGRDVAADFRAPVVVLLTTTAVAGFADGLAFLTYQTFVANQSGNLILLGLGVAGRYDGWHACLAALVGFTAGAAAGHVAGRRPASRGRAGAVIAIVVAAAMFVLWAAVVLAVPAGAAGRAVALSFVGGLPMGWLAASFSRTRGITTTTTYMTGTTLATTVAATDVAIGADAGRARRVAVLGVAGLAGYAGGAAIGAATWRGDAALVVVCAPVLLSTLLLLRRREVPGGSASDAG